MNVALPASWTMALIRIEARPVTVMQLLVRHHHQLQPLSLYPHHHRSGVDVHRLGAVRQHAAVPVDIKRPVAQQFHAGHAGRQIHRQIQPVHGLLADLRQLFGDLCHLLHLRCLFRG